MKKGKIDEKIMGPMFPRLHVNDTETGGPRAPPRNKMALYEQFSIPSQRHHNSRVSLLNPNKAADLSHPASSSRGTGLEKSCSGYSEFSLSSTQPPQQKQKRSGEEDDFQVPVYVQSMKGQDPKKKHSSSDPRFKARNHNENGSTKPVVENDKSRMALQGQWNQFKRIQTNDVNLLNESSRVYSNMANSKCTNASDEFISCMDTGYTSAPRIDLSSREQGHVDEASENTIVDSIDEVLSPDDVVAMIGQKCFWKARKQLLNQQRLFAVQIFELHRLTMVQKLIGGSIDILSEGDGYLKNPSEKPSTQQKDDTVEPMEKLDYSSVGKANPSTLQSQPPPPNNNTQISVTPPEITQLNAMGGLNQWPHYQPSGNHWLVPVMSPSEGLIYKPYPIPGFMGPASHNHNPHPFGYFPQYVMNQPQPVMGSTQTIPFHPPSVPHRSASRGSELLQQVSTASSPDVQVSEGRTGNVLPLFPTNSSSSNNPNAARVIKVVPHNARTASQSAARIFQAIQEGRK